MPTQYLTCGMPCAGKTNVAKQIETERGALRLTADEGMVELYRAEEGPDELKETHRCNVSI
jgi:predicted kinase